jgi:hypothetical protein
VDITPKALISGPESICLQKQIEIDAKHGKIDPIKNVCDLCGNTSPLTSLVQQPVEIEPS